MQRASLIPGHSHRPKKKPHPHQRSLRPLSPLPGCGHSCGCFASAEPHATWPRVSCFSECRVLTAHPPAARASPSPTFMANPFIRSSADGHLGCFPLLAIVNNAVMNINYEFLFEERFRSLLGTPTSGTARSCSNALCNFLRRSWSVFHSSCTVLHSHQQGVSFQFLHVLTNACHFPFS